MITGDMIVAHLVGDYILQSDWMATEKTKRSLAAFAHVLAYAIPFLFFRPSVAAMLFIIGTHFVIDRWRLARYVVWAKNFLGPWSRVVAAPTPNTAELSGPGGYFNEYKIVRWNPSWRECAATGYPPGRPDWLTVWLLIIADNTMHIICNGIAITYF
jgi:hypothetical protein